MKKRILSLVLAGAMALSLAACGGGGGGTSEKSGKVIDGNELDAEQYYNGYLFTEPSTLDSIKGNDNYSWSVLLNIMEPLTRLEEHDGKQERVGAGAESWEANEDGTVWTFKLRDNKWADGKAVTAADYAYGITQTLNPDAGSPNAFFITTIKNGVKVNNGELPVDELGVKVVDDKTLEITLENPTPYFMSLTDTRAMYPVRQDLVEQYGESYGAEPETVIGNGPFKIESWKHNSEIVLVKNEEYWDKDSVNLEKVTWQIINDENAIFNSFFSGSLDGCTTGTQEWMDKFDTMKNVERTDTVTPTLRYDFFNTKDEIFSNLNMRKAVTLAVNREDMATTIYQDTMYPAYSWVPQSVPTGEQGDYRDQVEEPLKAMMDEDPKELLLKGMEELGLGNDPSKLTIKYTLSATTQWARNYGEYCQQMLQNVLGVNVELDFNEWGTFQSKTNNGEYQMANMVWAIDYNDPMAMLEVLTSYANSIPTFWENAEYDALISEAAKEMDEAKRVELYAQAEKLLFEEGCIICPLVNEGSHSFRYSYVKNVNKMYTTTSGLKYVYISGR